MNRLHGLLLLLVLGTCAQAQVQAPTLEQVREQVGRGELDPALEAVESVILAADDDRQARFLKGVILTELGRSDEAIVVFEELVTDHQDLPEPHNNLAVLYAARGDLDRARDALLEAIAIHPSYAIAHENLGDIYTRMARIAYRRSVELDARNRGAAAKLELLVTATGLANASSAPAPMADAPVPAGAGVPSQQELLASVQRWAGHWSAQDVEAYLASYVDDFRPSRGVSRAQWSAQRRARLSEPGGIRVRISDFTLERVEPGRARVVFTQSYQSERYSDRVRKQLDLERVGNTWKIRSEKSLGAI